jgi:VanZ family protein
MNGILKYQRLTLWWALFVFLLCTVKMGSVSQAPIFFPGFDKLTHCGLFFVLAVLLCQGLLRHSGLRNLNINRSFFSLLIPIAFGAAIEVLQAYVFTWRSGEWADLFADSVGTAMGLFSVWVTLWAINYEKK